MWMNEYVHIMNISQQNFNDIFFAIFMVRVAASFILCDNRKLGMRILMSFEEHFCFSLTNFGTEQVGHDKF